MQEDKLPLQLYIRKTIHVYTSSISLFFRKECLLHTKKPGQSHQFAAKGLSDTQLAYMTDLVQADIPCSCLQSIFAYLCSINLFNSILSLFVCPLGWLPIINALSSESPVCSLVHPSDATISLLY